MECYSLPFGVTVADMFDQAIDVVYTSAQWAG
jgi:hypothetical protein